MLIEALKRLLSDVVLFARHGSGLMLRNYQIAAARAIVDSVLSRRGLTFVVAMSRQSGKNETQAQIESYLLLLLSQGDAEIVKASPTYKPQTENAIRRLERTLERNVLMRGRWRRQGGYLFRVGRAVMYFFSAQPSANVVGATASALLECDEAQDVLTSKWDKDFAPMAASTNATTVFWGTIWTSSTLLARELRAARAAEKLDGVRRVFMADADQVGAEVPAYAAYVKKQVAKLGRNHPLVKTQYYLEEIDGEGGMFPPQRRALMQGSHVRQSSPTPGAVYAALLDVAGEDEDAEGGEVREREPRRDSTALTIVEVDFATLSDELLQAPTYRVVERYLWMGTKHSQLYGRLKAIFELWGVRFAVVDSTGVGAGLSSFLQRALPSAVIPYLFTPKSKSDLGYGFLAVVESGRFKDWRMTDEHTERKQFERELDACEYVIRDGPAKMMSWGVPDGSRDPETGELLHDDLLISAAMCWVLDGQAWPLGIGTLVVQGRDPLADVDARR